MKKIISLALAGLITFSVGVGCGKDKGMINGKYDISNITIPEYTHDDHIDFTAYSGPTIENRIGSTHNINTVTEYHYGKLAEAGFTKVLALYEGGGASGDKDDPYQTIRNRSVRAQSDALRALEQAEKFGIKYYVRDWTFYGLAKEMTGLGIPYNEETCEAVVSEMFSESNQYINHPAFGGNFAYDEPTIQELEQIYLQVQMYKKYVGDRGEPIVNLYPSHASGPALSTGKYVTYKEYVQYYLETTGKLLGYVCYDFYPFKEDYYKGSNMKPQYLYNLELMALLCKETRKTENPIELRTFMQTIGDWTGLRSMTSIGDFRFQIYGALAFGSREIVYYEYANKNSHNVKDHWALLNAVDGTYNWTYDCAKTVNNEVKNFEDVYLNFEWEGLMINQADAMYDNKNFSYLTSVSESHPRIGSFTSSQDAFMTYFKDGNNNDAFMLVNFTDPYFQLDNEVTVQFKDAKALVMYRLGQKMIVPLGKDGKYTFKLYPGEGRFIIPVK